MLLFFLFFWSLLSFQTDLIFEQKIGGIRNEQKIEQKDQNFILFGHTGLCQG